MKHNEYNNFLDAVDVVCINCVKLSEENCEKCPVRITCDVLAGHITLENINKEKRTYSTMRCTCDRQPIQHMSSTNGIFLGYYYMCPICGLKSIPHIRKYKAVENWNNIMKHKE